ncbi:MAG: hypothetical protein ACI8RD_002092 [Bacillariaceae sp.]|jgi:hypothetical protein
MKSLLFRGRRRTAAIASIIVAVSVFLVVNQWRYAFIVHNRQDNRQSHQQTDEIEYQFHQNQQQHHQQQHHQERPAIVVNEIIHRAFFGLGHRLHRSAAAYHLARSLSLSSSQEKQQQDQPIITHLRFHWESCLAVSNGNNGNTNTTSKASGPEEEEEEEEEENKEYNVFRYLFGEDLWILNHHDDIISSSLYKNNNSRTNRRNMIIIRNDIPGYIAGQLYKDLKIPIDINSKKIMLVSSQVNRTKQTTDPSVGYNVILNKLMNSDVDFYRRLVNNYRFRSELHEFKFKHKWNERSLVVGLHLRAGNGEDAHFKESGRAASMKLNDESVLVSRLVQLINIIIIRETKDQNKQNNALPPLLFIATDTAHFLPLIEKAIITNEEISLRPEIITYPQYRLPRNAGVGFDALKGKGDSCLDGWKSAVNDALLLSEVDILIAAKRSTFTQSLPLTLGFDRNRNRNDDMLDNISNKDDDADHKSKKNITRINNKRFSFCEVSESDATSVTCVTDARTWLFRGEDNINGHTDSFKVDGYRTTEDARIWTVAIPTNTTATEIQKQQQQQQQYVAHKVTVLLPDIVAPKEFEQARDFLQRGNYNDDSPLSMTNNTEIRERIFHYGRSKIYKKYRYIHKENGSLKSSKSNNSNWNLVL